MAFQQLVLISQIPPYDTGYLDFVAEWEAKRNALIVMIGELPDLVLAHKGRVLGPHPNSPEITMYNAVPSIHLANACETVSHLVYSMAEVAARFGNKLVQEFPANFNSLRKKIRKGELSAEVTNALGDLQWYERMREIRTEWAHYSSPYIGDTDGEPSLVLRSFRSVDNRQQFTGHVSFSVNELSGWARAALATIDKFAEYLLHTQIVPKFDLDREITRMLYDATGFPIIRNGVPQSETMTVRDFMRRYKIIE